MLGDGSDEHPFIVSMTSIALLSVIPIAMNSTLPSVLHMDCTYKVNDNEFPVLVIGLTDAQQVFHLLSITVLSHKTAKFYTRALTALQAVVAQYHPTVNFAPDYCMTDAEKAERDALLDCFPTTYHLMCYFHVVKVCKEKLAGNAMTEQKHILRQIEELHSSIDQSEFDRLYTEFFLQWLHHDNPKFKAFALYFEDQWISGTVFTEWKVS